MCSSKGFFDLFVEFKSNSQLISVLTTLVKLGYRTVAINQTVSESAFDAKDKDKDKDKKKKKKGEPRDTDIIPPPVTLDNVPEELKKNLHILNRVTVHFSDSNQAYRLAHSENLKKYDVFAIVPLSQAALQHACNSMDVDIISVDPCIKQPVRWNRKLYNVAVEKNFWLELPYAFAVLNSLARKTLINIGHLYHAFGKSKNILVSSGAENPMQIRGPYDVINLGLLLGMSEEQSKGALTNSGRSVILRSERRRRGKAVVLIEVVRDEPLAKDHNNCSTKEDDADVDLQPAQKKLCMMEST